MVNRMLGMYQFHSRKFLRDATPATADAFRDILAQPKVQATFEIIKSALQERFGETTSEAWMATASYAIDQLRKVEDQSMAYLRQQIKDEAASAKQRFLLNAIVMISVLFALMLLAGSAIYHLLHALNLLLSNIERTVYTKDFSNRIQPQDSDEIGAISRNFNELLAIADRLIKEKDRLASTDTLTGAYNRRKFTDMFTSEVQRNLRYSGKLTRRKKNAGAEHVAGNNRHHRGQTEAALQRRHSVHYKRDILLTSQPQITIIKVEIATWRGS